MNNEVKEHILAGTMASLKMILTVPYLIEDLTETVPIDAMLHSVQIDLSGECNGAILIQGELAVYSYIGEGMFGMPISGELLESFIGEFANMLTGNLATLLSNYGLTTDISTPKFLKHVNVNQYSQPITIPIVLKEKEKNLMISLFINI
ncbi:chemotaxis protein CheX [Virgibacillus sp. 6R]|uniref:chemotaxis protein CheX n=1 Tax=Metabacillus sp. 22489 TaxID=3453928 RepID=UPI00210781E9